MANPGASGEREERVEKYGVLAESFGKLYSECERRFGWSIDALGSDLINALALSPSH